MRNGFTNGDPAVTGWPPSGAQKFDIFSRNFYLSGETDNILMNSHPDYSDVAWEYRPDDSAEGTTNDTDYNSNTIYPSRAAASADLGWTDPDLTSRAIVNYFRAGFNMPPLP